MHIYVLLILLRLINDDDDDDVDNDDDVALQRLKFLLRFSAEGSI